MYLFASRGLNQISLLLTNDFLLSFFRLLFFFPLLFRFQLLFATKNLPYLRIIFRSLISSWPIGWCVSKKCNGGRRTKCHAVVSNQQPSAILSVSVCLNLSARVKCLWTNRKEKETECVCFLNYLRLSRHEFDERTIHLTSKCITCIHVKQTLTIPSYLVRFISFHTNKYTDSSLPVASRANDFLVRARRWEAQPNSFSVVIVVVRSLS